MIDVVAIDEHKVHLIIVFLKWANRGLFFIYFCLFKHTLQFSQQINVKKCPSSKWCQDLNSQPLEHESPLTTPRPWFPTIRVDSLLNLINFFYQIGPRNAHLTVSVTRKNCQMSIKVAQK